MSRQTLQQFLTEMRKSKVRILSGVRATAYTESSNILEMLKLRSPLDKGLFRKNWEIRELGRTSSKKISFRLENRTFYGPWLDEGGEPGGVPWRWPSEKNSGTISKSGKLKLASGRVWAGGKSPAGFVEGGIVNQVIFYNVQKQVDLANNLADAFIGGL